ncbi:MAG: hypothetical protein OEM99_15250 [Gammaproteobacteria bacterium]|nr:hypothetical protein [Gammaproteobacteria bacterium]
MAQYDREDKNTRRDFSLGKYYVDFVTSEGHYFIGYSAQMNWLGVEVNYRATIHHPSIDGVKNGPSLSSRDAPVLDDSILTWRAPKLGFDGRWQQLSSADSHVLHREDDGLVEWNCVQPSAHAQLTTASGNTYEGLGYVEYLRMTITPWHLGLRTLLWGRFVSEIHSIVWIVWQGKHPLALLICDGKKIANPRVSDAKVQGDDLELLLERGDTIRVGSIGETLVSKLPSVLKSAPVEFLGGREEKYVSRGKLTYGDGSSHTGWVIHERVSWG